MPAWAAWRLGAGRRPSRQAAEGVQQSASSLRRLLQLGLELGHHLEEVVHNTVVGNLEDRCIRIRVHRDDRLRVLHAGEMLYRPRDAHGNIQVWRDHLARLSYLPIVGAVAGIDGCARRSESRTELIGQRLEHLEVLSALQPTTSSHDCRRARELWALALRELLADKPRARIGTGSRHVHCGDGGGSRARLRLLKGRGADREHLDCIERTHRAQRVAGVDRPQERIVAVDANHLCDGSHIQQRGNTRDHALADRGGGCEQVGVRRCLLHSEHHA
mmetsp:Transcript_17335/g.44838  ORF Transcript_17335/g.44838 Transcript_17335/m.44838 type:complete len:274 (+) Transcript_17335:223-1044(+)